ncbi:MAG: tetratricopeptide repeat protein [Candidatus Sumerlaeia bacterium]|nr:tetratricopeptide repeat protein [Candidatus Sumerlaeia bacterium]
MIQRKSLFFLVFFIPSTLFGDIVFEMAPPTPVEEAEPVARMTPKEQAVKILTDESLSTSERAARLRSLANANPDDGSSWSAYGEALEQAGDYSRAMEAFERASRVDSSLYTPWLWIGILAKRGIPEPDLPKAERAFRRALTEGAPRPRTLNELGVTLALQNKGNEAIRVWQQAIEADPDWGVLYNNIIRMARSMGRDELMHEMAERALHAERFEPAAIYLYGEWLLSNRRGDDAIAFYEKAMEIHPENLRFRYSHALALVQMGRKEPAMEKLREVNRIATEESPLSELALAYHLEIFKLEHPRDEATFQHARKLIFSNSDGSPARPRDLTRAVRTLDTIVEKHPELWNAYFARGRAQRLLGEYEDAEADLKRALEILPGEPNSTMDLALIRRDQYRFDEAADLADKAIERAPRDPLFAINGGLIMVDAGRCERGWELYRRLQRLTDEQFSVLLLDQLESNCREERR